MHLHFERTINAKGDCPILSLTWMGKVPDILPEDEGWKLSRNNYYQEGWLATGNVRGIVGVTFTTSHCKKYIDFPLRTNYNLRGHRSEVIMVKWNEPYQKLASCDSSGVIFVWIKYEGRWSIELINDRSIPVTHFAWSHDGRMALICYQDGFVLVGSVAGQRYWSSMLNLEGTITCGIWTPDDQQVYFGTTLGQVIVMDTHGAMVSEIHITGDIGITSMAWSCEKFKMEESDEENTTSSSGNKRYILAVSFQNGYIYLLSTVDDLAPIQINTELQSPLCMEWSNSREILAVAGISAKSPTLGPTSQCEYVNILQLYTDKGHLIFKTQIPHNLCKVSTLTWGHNDKRLFLATGTQIHIAWIAKHIASLQLLSRIKIYRLIPNELTLSRLPLPIKLKNNISNLFAQTIRCYVPDLNALRNFISRPPTGSIRLYCTMIKHIDETSDISYTLYLEYLGGLVPLMKGKRISKFKPEFVIFDPQTEDDQILHFNADISASANVSTYSYLSETSESEMEDSYNSPKVQRKKKKERFPLIQRACSAYRGQDELNYIDVLPEVKLAEVTSNIWGTKFKIHGLVDTVPANLGQVSYKTSLLHLQPRQMTLVITELRDDFPIGPDPSFNPNVFSEDEDEQQAAIADKDKAANSRINRENCVPIAPMSPRTCALTKQKAAYLRNHQKYSENHTDERNGGYSGVTSNDDLEEQNPNKTFRPQNLLRPTTSQNATSLIGLLGKSNSQNQKHAISPSCYEGSVPTLQSPKNAVAPVDIIFDRPAPPIPTNIMPFSTNNNNNNHNNIQQLSMHSEESTNKSTKQQDLLTDSPYQSCKSICSKPNNDTNKTIQPKIDSNISIVPASSIMLKSCSMGFLETASNNFQIVPPVLQVPPLSRGDNPKKRLVLVNNARRENRKRHPRVKIDTNKSNQFTKSKSLDYEELTLCHNSNQNKPATNDIPDRSNSNNMKAKVNTNSNNNNNNNNNVDKIANTTKILYSPLSTNRKRNGAKSCKKKEENGEKSDLQTLSNLEKLIAKLRENDSLRKPLLSANSSTSLLPKSSPSSPRPAKKGLRPHSASPIRKKFLQSPCLSRRKNKDNVESSDDDFNCSGDEMFNGKNYKDLETFQKLQLKQKLKRGKIEPNGMACCNQNVPQRREFVMHNKAPMWNEHSQVYQLDFGGRVTQESAKNFQIEFRGKQVMQFGRIGSNAYTLDFQYPFSALQAFAVALANVTQRLK